MTGLGALSAPGFAQAMFRQGFSHGVASGEPSANSALLWTRFVGTGDTRLTAEVSPDATFRNPVAGGSVTAMGARDHIAKITVNGLAPDRWYFYRFIAPGGQVSPVGRTRTLPAGETRQFNLGVFSCSNLPFGYFNAYAHAAARSDLDLMLHLGDYIYEYPRGTYPDLKDALPGRIIQPSDETITLADYRMRYASYRADPDLQRLHQLFPMVAQWDDHELANDSWKDGAQNHQPETEGDWDTRKKVAEQVYREWMPVRDRLPGEPQYDIYQIGNLATIFRTESRITGRDREADLGAALAGKGDLYASLARFRDDVWQDPARSMLGGTQEKWLAVNMAKSKRDGTKWQVWAQQTVMGSLELPAQAADWLPADAPDYVRARTLAGVAAAKAGLPFNFDSWDGYPAARARTLAAAQSVDSDLIVLSGDSHNAWSFDLSNDNRPAGVEFAGHSVTSPGFESFAKGIDPAVVARSLVAANSMLKWTDSVHRGYMSVMLTPDSVTCNFHNLASITVRSTALLGTNSFNVARGARQMVAA